MFRRNAALLACLLPLGACGASDPSAAPTNGATQPSPAEAAKAPAVSVAPRPSPSATLAALEPRRCDAEIGKAAAAQRVNICRTVSPATHPPCNAANSCAMIEDEIARSCALFDGDGEPMPGCVVDPKSSQAAADVVRRYYAAIDARDYGTAWTQWGDDGRPGQTLAAFEKGFAHTRATRVTIGALGPSEGAAGSIYQTVPVTVAATLDDGTAQRFTGSYVVRRVNGVAGASASQLRWHIDSAQLRPAPSK
ncbi:hypothetical protein [Sphingomonas sp. TDK1]|uniref:hypothetical protein n=1 Tax=Sphingomonas sp. TDK1 TaxID=453247 RepID=UPI0007D8E68B|nr:hypothetical protein [Sphingomonas sp. TDK1]OAN66561.1 hypothetical protein A7X12_10535 [Sphingomonas sp. TDK1]